MVTLLLLAACNGCAEVDPLPRSAVVIVLDGVRTDEFTGTKASDLTGVPGEDYADETWATLVSDGTVVRHAINPGVTITGPAHAAMLTGRDETYANFPVDPDVGAGLYLPEHPTIFEEARTQMGLTSEDIVLLANTELLMGVTRSLFPGYDGGARYSLLIDQGKDAPVNDDEPVVQELLTLLEKNPRLVVVNLHDVDRAGHYGEGDAYIEDVDKIDGLLADFWDTLSRERPELVASLLLIVTSDHGRHRHDEHDGFHNHGDACTGCREIPFVMIGGHAGAERTDTVVTTDIAPTVAAWLGIELPWAEGLPYSEAFESLDAHFRSGAIDLAIAGDHEVTQVWLPGRDARSEIEIDGAVVSTPGIYAAEAPALVDTPDGARVCFRELDLETGEDFLPWRPRCLAESDGSWSEMGFPVDEVGTFFRPALVERDGVVWAAWPNNPNEAADSGAEGEVGLDITPWTAAGGWGESIWSDAFFPTDPAVVATTRGLVVAFGTNLGDPDYRYTRRVRVVPVDLSGEPALDTGFDVTLFGLLGEAGRTEHPALAADGDHVRLAAIGHASWEAGGYTIVGVLESTDGGLSWGDPIAMPDAGPPFPQLAPAWDGAELVWAVAPEDREGEALLCRALPGDTEAACVGAGSPRIQSFVVQGGVATVIVDEGIGEWGRVVVGW